MSDSIKGTDWSQTEVAHCVDAYFACLQLQIEKRPFVKANIYKELSESTGRTAKSIEFKFQNISAVLNEMGLDWLSGLAPLGNYQKLLAEIISSREMEIKRISSTDQGAHDFFNEMSAFYIEAAPERSTEKIELPEFMENLIRKFDPVERDLRNRTLGKAGESLVLEYEKRFLQSIDRKDLAEQVRWVSEIEGDGAGYDILSFDDRGCKKHIEVKTTIGGNRTPFFVTRNEHNHSRKFPDEFKLTRVFDFRKSPRAFEINGPLEKFVRLSTETYRADFRA